MDVGTKASCFETKPKIFNAEAFTKQEYSITYGFSANNLRMWNECLPNDEPFSKDEINELIKANDNEHTT